MPAACGVPEIRPVVGLKPTPGGRLPLGANVTGAAPPVWASVVEYALPTVPHASDAVVTVGGIGVVAWASVVVHGDQL